MNKDIEERARELAETIDYMHHANSDGHYGTKEIIAQALLATDTRARAEERESLTAVVRKEAIKLAEEGQCSLEFSAIVWQRLTKAIRNGAVEGE